MCLPKHPAVAYLCLVRSMTRRPFTAALAFVLCWSVGGVVAHPTVPEHCFLNACSEPVELAAGVDGDVSRHTISPHDFFCTGPVSRAEIKFLSGETRHYDRASLTLLFPSLARAYQGYWIIRSNGLHHVSRSTYIETQQHLARTKIQPMDEANGSSCNERKRPCHDTLP
jgi:hypothetical protein